MIATSAGGPIGLRLALDHPERVESLILLNTGASLMSLSPSGVDAHDPFVQDRLATVAKRLALLDLLEAEGIEAVLRESESEWRDPPSPPDPGPVLDDVRRNRARALARLPKMELARLVRGAALNMRAQRDVDQLGKVSHIECPVLILHGDADTTVPISFGRALARSRPKTESIVFEGRGHGLIVDSSAQQVLAAWLDSR